MKKIVIISIYVLLIVFCLTGFKPFAEDALTFTMISQHPEKTMLKYKNIWNDRTIERLPNPGNTYRDDQLVGHITIPKMGYYEMPIYYGSDDVNNNWQITTAGYLGNWDMFGDKGVAVVGAHNYQLFKNLEALQPGDLFLIETSKDIFVYEVTGHTIFDHTKDSWVQTAYNDAQDYSVDLMTCYPIEQGGEDTQDRYIVYSKMVHGTQYVNK